MSPKAKHPKVVAKTVKHLKKGATDYLGVWETQYLEHITWFTGFTLPEIAAFIERKKLGSLAILFTKRSVRAAKQKAEGAFIMSGTIVYPKIVSVEARLIFSKKQVARGMRRAKRVFSLQKEVRKKRQK